MEMTGCNLNCSDFNYMTGEHFGAGRSGLFALSKWPAWKNSSGGHKQQTSTEPAVLGPRSATRWSHPLQPSKHKARWKQEILTCNSLRNLVLIAILLGEFRFSHLRLNWVLLLQFQSGINSASFQDQRLKPLIKNQDIYLNK